MMRPADMNTPPKKRRGLHLGRTLITGILAALPLLATLWLLSFLLGFVFLDVFGDDGVPRPPTLPALPSRDEAGRRRGR